MTMKPDASRADSSAAAVIVMAIRASCSAELRPSPVRPHQVNAPATASSSTSATNPGTLNAFLSINFPPLVSE